MPSQQNLALGILICETTKKATVYIHKMQTIAVSTRRVGEQLKLQLVVK